MTLQRTHLWRRVQKRPDEGWTLIELLVVLSLILILTSLALTQYRNSILSTKEAALRSNGQTVFFTEPERCCVIRNNWFKLVKQ